MKNILLLIAFLLSFSAYAEWADQGAVDRSVNTEQLECDDILGVATDETGSNSPNGNRWENFRHAEIRQVTPCLFEISEVTTNTTAACYESIPVDISGGAVTITKPTAATDCVFRVIDSTASASINNITVSFGADNFYGSTGSDILNTDGVVMMYKYLDASIGWVRYQ